MKNIIFSVFFLLIWEQVVAQEATPRYQPGANYDAQHPGAAPTL